MVDFENKVWLLIKKKIKTVLFPRDPSIVSDPQHLLVQKCMRRNKELREHIDFHLEKAECIRVFFYVRV